MAFSAISAPAQHQKPQLIITRQSSSAVEDVSKNGIKKRVHVVVKNNPFLLQVTIANTMFPVKSIPLEAFLVYDDGNKDVDFVKVKPVEFKTSANEFDKGVLTMEVKIKVLSSQLEDSFFRIKVIALHPLTKQKLNGLVVYSEPIKCVSKPSQVLKPKPSLLDKVKTVSSAKRKSEELLEYLSYTLEKVEQQCDAQLNALAHADHGFIPECKPEVHSEKQNNFETAFQQFMSAYGKLDADSRASKIRRFFGGMSAREQEQSSQLGSHLQENLKSERISAHADYLMPSSSFCQCESCPHQVELTKFNTFYDAFLSGPAFIDE